MSQDPQLADRAITPGNRLASLVISAVLVVVAAAAIWEARSFPSTGLNTDVGAGRFPIIFATILIALCLGLAIDTLKRPVIADPDAPSAAEIKKRVGNVAFGLAMMIAATLAIDWIGYIAATFIYLLVSIYAMGFRHKLWTPVVAALITAALYAAFAIGLNVPLPLGALFE